MHPLLQRWTRAEWARDVETSFAGGCVGRLNGRPDWLVGAPPSRKLSTLARSNQQLTRSAVGCAVPHHAVLIPVPPVECRPPGERSVLPTLLLVPPLRHRARRQQKETAKVPVGAESGVDCLQPRLLPREHHPREGNGGTTVHRCMHARRTHKASLLSVCRSLGCCLELWRAWTVRYNAGDAFAAYIPASHDFGHPRRHGRRQESRRGSCWRENGSHSPPVQQHRTLRVLASRCLFFPSQTGRKGQTICSRLHLSQSAQS